MARPRHNRTVGLLALSCATALISVLSAGSVYSPAEATVIDGGKVAQCADPSMLVPGGTNTNRYMFCTGGTVYTSSADALTWPTDSTQALTDQAPLACGNTWAPSVYKQPSSVGGKYVMLYGANRRTAVGGTCQDDDSANPVRCIFYATSTAPAGPYTSPSSSTVACDVNTYAAEYFLGVDGWPWIVAYRKDPNLGPLNFHKMTLDGTALAATDWKDTGIVRGDRAWETASDTPTHKAPVEGPAFLHVGNAESDYWVLFYSAGDWGTDNYDMGYAVCGTGKNPDPNSCTKPPSNKLGLSMDSSSGVGAGMAFLGAGGYYRLIAAGRYANQEKRWARLYKFQGLQATPPNNVSVVSPPVQ